MKNKNTDLTKEKLKRPIEIYRLGWLILASTAGIYIISFIIKNSFVMHYEIVKKPDFNKTIKLRETQKKEIQNDQHKKYGYYDKPDTNIRRSKQINTQALTSTHKNNRLANTGSKTATQSFDQDTKNLTHFTSLENNKSFFVNQSGYVDSFTHSLPMNSFELTNTASHTPTQKTKPKKNTLFGVHLVKGRNIPEVRRNWFKLRKKYRKYFRNLEPLIIKENTGDGRPIKLVLGPFSNALMAVKLCRNIKRRNCNIKLYNGTPL